MCNEENHQKVLLPCGHSICASCWFLSVKENAMTKCDVCPFNSTDLKKHADDGNCNAQYILERMHRNGKEDEKDNDYVNMEQYYDEEINKIQKQQADITQRIGKLELESSRWDEQIEILDLENFNLSIQIKQLESEKLASMCRSSETTKK